MHRANRIVIIGWFVATPFVVVFFTRMGMGVDGMLAAIVLTSLVSWLISLAVKKVKSLFPGWGALLTWSRTGEIVYDEGEEGAGEEWQFSTDGQEEQGYQEARLPNTTALLPTSGRMEDLHPAVRGAPLSTRPKSPPRYSFSFGSHSMDMEIMYGTGLVVAPEHPSGITWIIAKELTRLRVTSLVIDFTGGFDTLPLGNTTGYLLGHPASPIPTKLQQRLIPVTAQEAGKVGRWLVHQGGQYVLRFHSYPNPVEATYTLLYLLQGMYKLEQERIAENSDPVRCVVFINQAHQFLPYKDQYSIANADPALAQRLRTHLEHYLSKGSQYGLHFYLVTDKPTRMKAIGLEQDIWFVQNPQFEELRYLAESTGFPMEAFTSVSSNQTLFMDIVNKMSLVVTLPEHPSDIIEELVYPAAFPTPTSALSPITEEGPYGTEGAAATVHQQPMVFSQQAPRSLPVGSVQARSATSQEEDQESFPDKWRAWVCYLYSINRMRPSTVQHAPNELVAVAQGLGLPIDKDDMVRRARAARWIGVVQKMTPQQRSKYAARAAHFASPQEAEGGRGGVSRTGSDPPIWKLPSSAAVLNQPEKGGPRFSKEMLEDLRVIVQRTLDEQHVAADIFHPDICIGPKVIQFGIRPRRYQEMVADRKGPGQRIPKTDSSGEPIFSRTPVKDIMRLEPDFALALNELGLFGTKEGVKLRMVESIPGTGCVGLEVPNPMPENVSFRQVVESREFREAITSGPPLPVAMGKDIAGHYIIPSRQSEPHRITGGATGAGKSVAVNVGICSVLMHYSPEDVRMVFIDPKEVELRAYADIPHLLAPIAITADKARPLLVRLGIEMDRRFGILAQAGVRDLEKYRLKRKEHPELENLPFIVVIIDELADLMMQTPKAERADMEKRICRLMQKGRAAGIHVELATQRPSVDVITGLMKANAPARIVFRTSSSVDSRVIIDENGAENLLGRGDGLYKGPEVSVRFQHALVEDEEITAIVSHWLKQKERVDAAHSSTYASYTLPEEPISEEEGEQEEDDEWQGPAQREEVQQETLGEKDSAYPLVVAALPHLLAEKQLFSVDRLRRGNLTSGLGSMTHQRAVAIREALIEQGFIAPYDKSLRGSPILDAHTEGGVAQQVEVPSHT